MSSDTLERTLSLGDSREERSLTEWLDLKGRVEEEKFHKLSADLERRRTWKFLKHAEEKRKIVLELNNLQRERLRFEREKQLRQRNSFSTSRERRRSICMENKSLAEVGTKLPVNDKSFGASASLAFDPTITKSPRRQRRSSKQQLTNYRSLRKASKDLSTSNVFPNIEEDDVQRFHKHCKSASRSECRRWGAAWFYAKKEQDLAEDGKRRWTSLLLKFEKEKMRVLGEKGVAFLDDGLDGKCLMDDKNKFSRKTSNEKDNEQSFDGAKYLSSSIYQGKDSANNSSENFELSKKDKLTFHKAFGRVSTERVDFADEENSTFHKAHGVLLEENENSASSVLRPAPTTDFLKEDQKPRGGEVHETADNDPVDCKSNKSLLKGAGKNNSLKRSKRIRIHATEGREDYNGNVLPRMPAIPELQVDESSSNSSIEKMNNLPRRKRGVFLPSLANN